MKVKMVLNMKQGEKNKKLGGKKNRKLSTYKDPQNQLDREDSLKKDAKNDIHIHRMSPKKRKACPNLKISQMPPLLRRVSPWRAW